MEAPGASGFEVVPSVYEYQPLRESQIRLLSILPGEWGEVLRCSIYSTIPPHKWERRFTYLQSYEALSYVWGDASETVPVACGANGEAVFVTSNCLSAMRRLRLSTEARVVWIDAVCINQNDISERNAQVRMMPTIYGGAMRVIAYLGEDDNDSIEAINHIHDMTVPKGNQRAADLSRIFDHWEKPMSDQEKQNRRNEAVQAFLQRPWFNRVWVLQEVTKAREIMVICGTSTIDWNKISAFYRISSYKGSPIDVKGLSPTVITLFPRREMETRALSGLLQLTRRCEATDPRDKVFALLGILIDAEEHGLVADYNKSYIQVFSEAAVWTIKAFGNLEVLSAVQGPTLLHFAGLPSWVPDWSVPVQRSKMVDLFDEEPFPFCAGGKQSNARVFWEEGNIRRLVLEARGVVIGKIVRLGGTYDREQVDSDALHELFDLWTNFAIDDGKYGSPELNEFAMCLSMCIGSGLLQRVQGIMPLFVDFILWRARHLREDISPYAEMDELIQRYCIKDTASLPPEHEMKNLIARADSFHAGVQKHCHLRRLLVTDNGYIGLAPEEASIGNIVCILYGARTPQVLERDGGRFGMVGECYIQGAMFGEALPERHPDRYQNESGGWGPAGPSLDGSERDFEIA